MATKKQKTEVKVLKSFVAFKTMHKAGETIELTDEEMEMIDKNGNGTLIEIPEKEESPKDDPKDKGKSGDKDGDPKKDDAAKVEAENQDKKTDDKK